MGRFVSGGGASLLVPREQSLRLLASNPAIPIPSWARIAEITGCGGGQAGAAATNAGNAATSALRHPLILPVGALSMGVLIGAAGVVPSGAGGDTVITIDGVNHCRLLGGSGGDTYPEYWDSTQGQWRSAARRATGDPNTAQVWGLSLTWNCRAEGSSPGSSLFGNGGNAGFGGGGRVNQPGGPGFLLILFREAQ